MQTDILRAGIVGCGAISEVHAHCLAQLPGVKLTACADIRKERARAMGCAAYASLEEMLDAEPPDVLHICTPHSLHPEMIELAVSRGIAVLTEKPPVTTREQLNRLLQLPETAHVGVCFQNRWNPSVKRAQSLLESGELGEALGIRAFVTWSRGADYYTESGWRGQWATEGGGALINQSIHTLDLMLMMLGAPDSVKANLANHHLTGVIEVEDTLEAYLRFGEVTGLLYATTAFAADAPVLIDIHCERGVIRIEGPNASVQTEGSPFSPIFTEQAQSPAKAYWGNGHSPCIEAFYQSIRTDTPFPTSLKTVAPTLDCMLRIYEAAGYAVRD